MNSSKILEMRKTILGDKLFRPGLDIDPRFLALAICGEAGELANMIKKRWRDTSLYAQGDEFEQWREAVRDEIADIRIYLELIAAVYDIEGDKLDARVEDKLRRVMERRKKQLGLT